MQKPDRAGAWRAAHSGLVLAAVGHAFWVWLAVTALQSPTQRGLEFATFWLAVWAPAASIALGLGVRDAYLRRPKTYSDTTISSVFLALACLYAAGRGLSHLLA